MSDLEQQKPDELLTKRDLLQELFEDLTNRFASALEADGSLPIAVHTALTGLLGSEAATVADIIEAVSKNDPESEGSSDE